MAVKECDLQSWKLLQRFRQRLRPHLAAAVKTPTEQDPRALLVAEDYFCLLLFGLFNPVLRAVNRMAWASVGKNGRAVKLHLHFSVFDQVPQDWTITAGNCCERKVLKSKAQSGAFYVADRLYSDDYAFLGRMLRQKIDFVMRLPGNATRRGAAPDRMLTAQDRAAGVGL